MNRSTVIGSRDDCVRLRDRMADRQRRVDDHHTSVAVEHPPLKPLDGSVANVDRCRSLKDRIYDRIVRPMSTPPFEPTKDVYAHEVSMPVRTVYDVERVATAGFAGVRGLQAAESRGGPGEMLLVGTESAALVRQLEERLGMALQRNAVLEEDTESYRLAHETIATRLATAEKTIMSFEARNDELLKQVEEVRKEARREIEAARAEAAAQGAVALDQTKAHLNAEAGQMRDEMATYRATVKDLNAEKFRLESLVAELKEQLTQNNVSLQTSTQTIRQLTNELLQAKQQTSFISTGYKKVETDLRTSSAMQHAQASELAVLRTAAKELEAERELRTKLAVELEAAKKRLAEMEHPEKERKELLEKCAKLEADIYDKNNRLSELRGHVDLVRSQANQAFVHSNKFLQGGAMDPLMMSRGPENTHNDQLLGEIRRELEAEEQRVTEEKRRWQSRATPSYNAAPSYGAGGGSRV